MFRDVTVLDIKENAVKLISKDWMLVTAGNEEKGYNTMTASWGTIGELWGKPVATVFIRPQRYTLDFVEANDQFTLSFLEDGNREVLSYCGSRSGRDCDKVKDTGLNPIFHDDITYFEQAKLVLVCKKLAVSEISGDQFLDKELDERWYADKDYHKIFIAEIERVLVKE